MADEQEPLASAAAASSTEPGNELEDVSDLAAASGQEAARITAQAVSGEPTAAASSRAGDPGKSIIDDIAALRAQQKKLKDDKKVLTKNLRNAERRRSRLKKRAKALSDADLLAVISLRNHEKALGTVEVGAEDSDSDSDGAEDGSERQESPAAPSAKASPKKKQRIN